jgi:hypothetical protein
MNVTAWAGLQSASVSWRYSERSVTVRSSNAFSPPTTVIFSTLSTIFVFIAFNQAPKSVNPGEVGSRPVLEVELALSFLNQTSQNNTAIHN